jgi:hypothetical protein
VDVQENRQAPWGCLITLWVVGATVTGLLAYGAWRVRGIECLGEDSFGPGYDRCVRNSGDTWVGVVFFGAVAIIVATVFILGWHVRRGRDRRSGTET